MPDRWIHSQRSGPPPRTGSPQHGAPPAPHGTSRTAPAGWERSPQQVPGWGPPPPTSPSPRGPWWRRWYVVLAAAVVALGLVASIDNDASNTSSRSSSAPTSLAALPTVTTALPSTSASPSTTLAKVNVPKLAGMKLARAKDAIADRGLAATIRYKSTARYPAGTVISQSHRAGVGVLPHSRITLVVAKAPPPPPSTAPPPPTTTPSRNCDPSYPDVCLDPTAVDYDCAGGSGNGPKYVSGPIRVRAPDPFDLDRDGDGWGCED